MSKDELLGKIALYGLISIFIILVVILSALVGSSRAEEIKSGTAVCEQAHKRAYETQRMARVSPSSPLKRLREVKEWASDHKRQILLEAISECGWGYQYIDSTQNGQPNYIIVWKPTSTPNGIIWLFAGKINRCPRTV
jgi:hypothetical protein